MSATVAADGRTARRDRNSEAVVEAILDLVRAGNERPTIADVAQRAQVSERTVFRHFDDIESLFAAAVARHLESLLPTLAAPPATGPLADRISAFVDARAALFERITPVRRFALRTAGEHPSVRTGLEWTEARLRDQVAAAFAVELGGVRGAARGVLLESLDVVASWATWDALRTGRRLSPSLARRVLTHLLTALLTD